MVFKKYFLFFLSSLSLSLSLSLCFYLRVTNGDVRWRVRYVKINACRRGFSSRYCYCSDISSEILHQKRSVSYF